MGTGLNALGEKQVNFSTNGGPDGLAGTQGDPAVTALANGDFVVVYENPQAGRQSAGAFLRRERKCDPSACIERAPERVSSTLIQPRTFRSIPQSPRRPTADFSSPIPTPRSHSTSLVTNVTFEVNNIDVRRYDNTTGLSAPFVIDIGAAIIHLPNAGPVDNPAIAAFADGTSIVTWEFDYGNQAGGRRRLFRVSQFHRQRVPLLAGSRSAPLDVAQRLPRRGQGRNSGNLAAIVYAADRGPLTGQDIILDGCLIPRRTELVAPDHYFWRREPDRLFRSRRGGAERWTLRRRRARRYDVRPGRKHLRSRHARGDSRAQPPGILAAGANPHVAGVPGGGFVVSFDNSSGNVIEQRFGPDGSVLFNPGVANSVTTGTQDQNAIAANASGTVFVAWQDGSSGNPNSTDADTRIEAQAFHAPPLPQENFNGDLHSDILWQNANGQASVWEMSGNTRTGGGPVSANPGPAWRAIGPGDFNDDGFSDILFQNTTTGQASVWEMNGHTRIGGGPVSPNPGTAWKAIGTGDFDGDGHSDILWQNASSGQASIWEMNGNTRTGGGPVTPNPGPSLDSDWKRRFQPRRPFRHLVAEQEHRPSLDLGNERERVDRRRTREPQSRACLESDRNGRFQ